MVKLTSHVDVINLWPSVPEFARDLGVLEITAYKMRARNSINVRHWKRLQRAAARRGFGNITYAMMAQMMSGRRAA